MGRIDLQIASQAGELLAVVHNQTGEMRDLESLFEETKAFEQLRVQPLYEHVAAAFPEIQKAVESQARDLMETRLRLVLGDLRPRNILINNGQLYLVDFAAAHFGQPSFDLAFYAGDMCLKAMLNHPQKAAYLEAINVFWGSYSRNAEYEEAAAVCRSAVRHFGCLLLAQVCGRLPVYEGRRGLPGPHLPDLPEPAGHRTGEDRGHHRIHQSNADRWMRCAPAAILLVLGGCAPGPSPDSGDARSGVPPPAREFRAVWVATVDNIDWPSRPGLTSGRQRLEARAILDRSRELGLNAVVLQVRPHCDALYSSPLEPWSYYLSGRPGEPPEAALRPPWNSGWRRPTPGASSCTPGSIPTGRITRQTWEGSPRSRSPAAGPTWCAPSATAVTGGSTRGPRRSATTPSPSSSTWPPATTWTACTSTTTSTRTHPTATAPTSPTDRPGRPTGMGAAASSGRTGAARTSTGSSRACTTACGTCRERSSSESAPSGSGARGIRPRSRRESISTEPSSPTPGAGCTRAGSTTAPPSSTGRSPGWPRASRSCSPGGARNNPHGRHVWPGLYTSSVGSRGWPSREIVDQIMVTRGLLEPGPGHIHFSARAVLDSGRVGAGGDGLNAALAKGPYRVPALVPATPWLDDQPPEEPVVAARLEAGGLLLDWARPEGEPPFLYVVYTKGRESGWRHRIVPAARTELRVPLRGAAEEGEVESVAVTSVDRMGNESDLRVPPSRRSPVTGAALPLARASGIFCGEHASDRRHRNTDRAGAHGRALPRHHRGPLPPAHGGRTRLPGAQLQRSRRSGEAPRGHPQPHGDLGRPAALGGGTRPSGLSMWGGARAGRPPPLPRGMQGRLA